MARQYPYNAQRRISVLERDYHVLSDKEISTIGEKAYTVNSLEDFKDILRTRRHSFPSSMLSAYVESLFDCFQVSLQNSQPPPQIEEATFQVRRRTAQAKPRHGTVPPSYQLPPVTTQLRQHPSSVKNSGFSRLPPTKHWPVPPPPIPRATISVQDQSQNRRLQNDITFQSDSENAQNP